MRTLFSIVAILFATNTFAATTYELDTAHTTVGFKIDHLVVAKVSGRFDQFEGTFTFDDKAGKLENLKAKIDLDSVNTSNQKRDDHLRNKDFFGVRDDNGKLVEKKRWMTFTGKKTTFENGKPTQVTGDLTLNGVTKPVTMKLDYRGTVKDPWGNTKMGFTATTEILRSVYKLTWNKALETGGFVVGDKVDIIIEGEALAQQTTVK